MIRPPLNNHCSECEGHGYDVFEAVDGPAEEIQANDGCDCLWGRFADTYEVDAQVTDDDARIAFVIDLERKDRWAQRCARRLMP